MPVPLAALAIGGAALGGLAGALGSKQTQDSEQRVNLMPASELENQSTASLGKNFGTYSDYVNAGANQTDVSNALTSQRGLADMLKSYSTGGYLPGQQDFAQANSLADSVLSPAFRQQEEQAARLAAKMNRPVNDPILQARLRQGLADQRSGFVAEQAMNAPLQRLQFAGQLSDVQNNLASQAMSNRQALLSLGNQLQSSERNFRLQTATRTGSQTQTSGGGLQGAIAGALGGAGAGFGMANSMAQMNTWDKIGSAVGSAAGAYGAASRGPQFAQAPIYDASNLGGFNMTAPQNLSFGQPAAATGSRFRAPVAPTAPVQSFGGISMSVNPAAFNQPYRAPLPAPQAPSFWDGSSLF
jgi:hypothetical protein